MPDDGRFSPLTIHSLFFVHRNISYGSNIGRGVSTEIVTHPLWNQLMLTERPYPGQLWKHDSIRVIVVAVSPNTVTYEDLPRRAGVTRDSLNNFLESFTKLKSPAR